MFYQTPDDPRRHQPRKGPATAPTIEQICKELPALHAHILDLAEPSLQAIRYTAAHVTGARADSLPPPGTFRKYRRARNRLWSMAIMTLRRAGLVLRLSRHPATRRCEC